MKLLLSCFVAAFLLDIGVVQAQVATTATGANPVVVLTRTGLLRVRATRYHYARSATSFEGYARGIADVVRSQGLYNLNSSVAAIDLSERGVGKSKTPSDGSRPTLRSARSISGCSVPSSNGCGPRLRNGQALPRPSDRGGWVRMNWIP